MQTAVDEDRQFVVHATSAGGEEVALRSRTSGTLLYNAQCL